MRKHGLNSRFAWLKFQGWLTEIAGQGWLTNIPGPPVLPVQALLVLLILVPPVLLVPVPPVLLVLARCSSVPVLPVLDPSPGPSGAPCPGPANPLGPNPA